MAWPRLIMDEKRGTVNLSTLYLCIKTACDTFRVQLLQTLEMVQYDFWRIFDGTIRTRRLRIRILIHRGVIPIVIHPLWSSNDECPRVVHCWFCHYIAPKITSIRNRQSFCSGIFQVILLLASNSFKFCPMLLLIKLIS